MRRVRYCVLLTFIMHSQDFISLCKNCCASIAQHQMEEELFTEVSMEIEGIKGIDIE